MTRASQLRSVALALLLIVATVAVGPGAQTAVAAEAGNCSSLDDFIMFLTLGAVNAEDCTREAYVQAAVEDMEESDASQTKLDIYNAGIQANGSFNTWMAPYGNYLNDSKSVAWSKAEVAVAEAYQNGASESEAKVQAKNAIRQYYQTKQINLIERWNVSASEVYTMSQQAKQEDGISGTYVTWMFEGGDNVDYGTVDSTGVKQVTLLNGTTKNATTVTVSGNGWSAGSSSFTNSFSKTFGPPTWEADYANHGLSAHWFIVKSHDGEADRLEPVMDTREMREAWSRIETQNSQLQADADAFVTATYDDYTAGEINASDVISANTAMYEYGVRSGNETEGLYNSLGAIALGGFDSAELNGTGQMSVTWNGNTYDGLVFARNVPNGSWEAGKTYNTSNITGPVFIATTDGKKVDIPEGDTFTVEEITARDGSTMDSLSTVKYRYQTANTSELQEVVDRLTDLRLEIEDRETASIGTGDEGGLGGLGGLGETELFLIAAGAVALLLFRG